jgi:hypothetical protein
MNFQPVVPLSLNDEWHVIVRTIVPVISEGETVAGAGSNFGMGDITQSFFFSPQSHDGFTWGAGPAFLWPAATDTAVGSQKWGIGPTAVLLQQSHGWTVGMLANHIWSYGGNAQRSSVNSTFLQPFLGYTWPDSTGLTFNTETTYDWTAKAGSVPLNLSLSHLYKIGGLPISLQAGGRWYPVTFPQGPRWGLRFSMVFLFPE